MHHAIMPHAFILTELFSRKEGVKKFTLNHAKKKQLRIKGQIQTRVKTAPFGGVSVCVPSSPQKENEFLSGCMTIDPAQMLALT